jgi:hypothetical protein
MWLDSGRMRSLTGGVCIKLLTKLRHNQRSPLADEAAADFMPATLCERITASSRAQDNVKYFLG